MDVTKLVTFGKFFKSTIDALDNIFYDKKQIITFKDILYCCLYMNGLSCSYSLTNINMYMNDIIDVSNTALKNKRDTYSYIYFKQICNTLLDFIYNDNNNTSRIIAVDGTNIPLSINLKKYGFSTSVNNTYCRGLVSSLFDVNNKMLINYMLCKKYDEREVLMKQIDYLRPNDILIIDRGYYSKELLFFLNKNSIKVIFRMKSNSLMVKVTLAGLLAAQAVTLSVT